MVDVPWVRLSLISRALPLILHPVNPLSDKINSVRVRPRYYIVGDDGTFSRLAIASFYRIVRQDAREVHPEFRGQRVKYAEIFVALDGRRPVAARHAAFGYLSFDGEGRFDAAEWGKFADLMVQAWPSPVPSDHDNVSEMRICLAERQLDEDHNWTPTAALRDQLYDAALHDRATGGNVLA